MFTRLVCGNGRNNKHKECCFVVPRNLLSLTMIREQMAEAVSWLVSPGKQEVGDDKRLVISLSGASLPQALPERIDASLKPHLWSLVQYFIFFFFFKERKHRGLVLCLCEIFRKLNNLFAPERELSAVSKR